MTKQDLIEMVKDGRLSTNQFLQSMHLLGFIKLPTLVKTRRMSKAALERLDAKGINIIITN